MSGSPFLSQWVSLFFNRPQTLWFSMLNYISLKTWEGVEEIYDWMKQLYACMCHYHARVCLFWACNPEKKKKNTLACRQQRDNRKEVMQSFQLRFLIYSRLWSFLQHIHTSSCLNCQFPSVAQTTHWGLLLAATSAEQRPLASFLVALNQSDNKVIDHVLNDSTISIYLFYTIF